VRINEARPDSIIGLHIEDADSNRILVSTDDEYGESFLEHRKPGDYILEVWIPEKILKPGTYHVSLSARGQMDKPYHKLDHCLSFEVIDTQTYRGMKGLYRKQALVAPQLTWQEVNEKVNR
jgi:hypothetical protein